ncbi:YybH family protein [Nocardia sp. NPDC127606]|uniref:YybH family protein n=1 Tax=Nocardia sp. NPDC127606 TaxID=3345406 RepID=UPI00363B0E06
MTAALERGDIDTDMSFCIDDAVVAFEPGAPVRGEEQLRAGFAAFAAVKPDFRYDNGHEVMLTGDIAVHIAPWTMSGTAPDGTPIAQT